MKKLFKLALLLSLLLAFSSCNLNSPKEANTKIENNSAGSEEKNDLADVEEYDPNELEKIKPVEDYEPQAAGHEEGAEEGEQVVEVKDKKVSDDFKKEANAEITNSQDTYLEDYILNNPGSEGAYISEAIEIENSLVYPVISSDNFIGYLQAINTDNEILIQAMDKLEGIDFTKSLDQLNKDHPEVDKFELLANKTIFDSVKNGLSPIN